MLSGHNTDVLYRGVVFHVQTEVSGRQGVRVVTQLFHGGNVLASEEQSCEDLAVAADRAREVRERMVGQHRSVADRLKRGAFDRDIEQRLGASIFAPRADVTDTADALEPQAPEAAAAAERREPPSPAGREFGDNVVSEKPLDEVVLDYLVENARRRRRRDAT